MPYGNYPDFLTRPLRSSLAAMRLSTSLATLALATQGCLRVSTGTEESAASADDTGSDDVMADVPEGSCDAWKIAYCKAVKRCGSIAEKSSCEDDVGYVICRTEAPYAECQVELDNISTEDADCSDWPEACEPRDIADLSEPTSACVRLHAAKCEWSLFCSSDNSIETCTTALEAAEPCSSFTAVLPDAEACIDYFATIACGDFIPPECAMSEILRK